MSDGLQPYFDLLGDFMVAVDFPNQFVKPLPIKPNNNGDFALITAVESWLYQAEGRIVLKAKDIGDQNDPSGLLLRREESAEIHYSNDLNTCWKRFVVAKELSHLIIEAIYGDEINVIELLDSVSVPVSKSNIYGCYNLEDRRGRSELLAVFVAEYLLMPWFETDYIRTSGKTAQELAVEYMVPVALIESRMDPRDNELLDLMRQAYERRLAQVQSAKV